jgi:hypothetical protein
MPTPLTRYIGLKLVNIGNDPTEFEKNEYETNVTRLSAGLTGLEHEAMAGMAILNAPKLWGTRHSQQKRLYKMPLIPWTDEEWPDKIKQVTSDLCRFFNFKPKYHGAAIIVGNEWRFIGQEPSVESPSIVSFFHQQYYIQKGSLAYNINKSLFKSIDNGETVYNHFPMVFLFVTGTNDIFKMAEKKFQQRNTSSMSSSGVSSAHTDGTGSGSSVASSDGGSVDGERCETKKRSSEYVLFQLKKLNLKF